MPDTITARSSNAKYLSHPEGQFVAQCVDVIDLGDKVEQYQDAPKKLVPKCALVFRTGEKNAETGEYIDIAREFTISMGDTANLRQFLEQWRGKPYKPETVSEGVPLHKLTGNYGLLTIAHKLSKQGRTYANITACVGVPKQMTSTLTAYDDYERADYWATRKQEYAEGVRAFKAATAAPDEPSGEDYAATNYGDDDSNLPF